MNGTSLKKLRHALENKKGIRAHQQRQLKAMQIELDALIVELEYAVEEQLIIQIVAKETQSELEYKISELVSLAMQSVFDDPYEFAVDFVIRRGQTEADLYFKRNGQRYDPLTACGVGAVDVASFGLRMARWTMANPKSRNVLLLDEPFKHVKGLKDNERALAMVVELSHRLKVQIIMVSDERVPREMVIDLADKVYLSNYLAGVSYAEEIK
jgi:hypothetical protein